MEQRMITQQEKTAKEMRAEEKVRRAQASGRQNEKNNITGTCS